MDKVEQSEKETPVVNLRALEETLEIDGAKEIATGFLEDVVTVPARLRGSIESKNAEALRQVSHMLKGCCRIIMAPDTADLAAKMEAIAGDKRWDDAEKLLPDLLASFDITVNCLQEYLA